MRSVLPECFFICSFVLFCIVSPGQKEPRLQKDSSSVVILLGANLLPYIFIKQMHTNANDNTLALVHPSTSDRAWQGSKGMTLKSMVPSRLPTILHLSCAGCGAEKLDSG